MWDNCGRAARSKSVLCGLRALCSRGDVLSADHCRSGVAEARFESRNFGRQTPAKLFEGAVACPNALKVAPHIFEHRFLAL